MDQGKRRTGRIAAIAALLAIGWVGSAPSPARAEPVDWSYSIESSDDGDCLPAPTPGTEGVQEADLVPLPDGFEVTWTLVYLCCARLDVQVELVGDEIRAIARHSGDPGLLCRCFCRYRLWGRAASLSPGNYRLRLYGVGTTADGDRPLPLLSEETVAVPAPQ